MKRRLIVLVLAALCCCGQGVAQGSDSEMSMLKLENAELRHRLEVMEDTLLSIQSTLQQEKEAKEAKQAEVAKQETPVAVPVAAPAKPEKPSIKSKYDVELYGYTKLDGSTDDSRMTNNNFAQWVNSEATRAGDSQFNMTANQTRFGLKFAGPREGDAAVSGQIEMDFYGGGAQNKSNPMMRQAFATVAWAKNDVSLTAGQTSDVISPLVPGTLNYSVAWWAGNIGYRHPQIRLTKGFASGKNNRLELQLAAVRAIGDAGPFTFSDTGNDSSRPNFQGRVSYSFPMCKNKKAVIGISGHQGREEYKTDATTKDITVDSKSTSVDLALPLGDKIQLRGEMFAGENLDDFLGGIAQGVVVTNASGTRVNVPRAGEAAMAITRVESIKSRGGWAELAFGPFQRWSFNIGLSRENLDGDNLPNGARTDNESRWLTIMHDLTSAVQVGLEFSRWQTDYKNVDQGVNNRIQTSVIYKF